MDIFDIVGSNDFTLYCLMCFILSGYDFLICGHTYKQTRYHFPLAPTHFELCCG